MSFICFKIVDFPDSPAPNNSILISFLQAQRDEKSAC